jgi:DNA-binding response OmpR family regulator
MAAVLGIVRSYGGTCRVDSSDKGNQVTLFFPVIAENDWNVEGSHCHVLLVEEQPTVRLSIGSFLKQRGYDVCSVESGHAALEYLNSDVQGPVAILLDVDMPSTNDFECFDAMRELRPGVPIVLMSWFSVDQIRKEFSERTVQDVLPKPLRLPELERIIRMNVGEP